MGADDASAPRGPGASPGATGRGARGARRARAPDATGGQVPRDRDAGRRGGGAEGADGADGADGAVRYRLLETLRQYARERLRAAGDAATARDRHAAHFLARTEALGGRVERAAMRLSAEEFRWFAREHDNLRAALAGLRDRGDAERALRLGASLGRVWFHSGHLSEGRAWLRAAAGPPRRRHPPGAVGAARLGARHVGEFGAAAGRLRRGAGPARGGPHPGAGGGRPAGGGLLAQPPGDGGCGGGGRRHRPRPRRRDAGRRRGPRRPHLAGRG